MSSLVKFVEDGQIEKFVSRDEFNKFLSQEPPESFIKDHPLATGVKYIPIDKVELMLTKIFQQWHVEIMREGQLLNSVYTAVRLHYYYPVEDKWKFSDGIGAAPIKTDKGASAADMAAIKNDAITTGLPAAESFAIKDAAEKLGRIFGKDLNRRDVIDFTPLYGTEAVKNDADSIQLAIDGINDCTTMEELQNFYLTLGKFTRYEKVIVAKDKRKAELSADNR